LDEVVTSQQIPRVFFCEADNSFLTMLGEESFCSKPFDISGIRLLCLNFKYQPIHSQTLFFVSFHVNFISELFLRVKCKNYRPMKNKRIANIFHFFTHNINCLIVRWKVGGWGQK
jgi:hypothetical protein